MIGREFRAVFTAQARYSAPVVALATVALAALPLLTLQGVASDLRSWQDRASLLITQSQFFSPFYPAAAVALGSFFAAANWLPDANGRWAYALTLPISRPRLAALRLGAGALLTAPGIFALWVVGAIGAKVADLPAVIQANPGALALRFGAATLVVYSAASLLTLLGRRAWYLALGFVILLLLQGFGINAFTSIVDALFLSPFSPFHSLAGQWLYLDV